jgi:hypothetical protein
MSRNVFPENALSLRFHVLSFPCIATEPSLFSSAAAAKPQNQNHLALHETIIGSGRVTNTCLSCMLDEIF